MKLASSFEVPAEPSRVFELFLDAPTLRACIPGCEELTRIDESHYAGRLVNEIAHVRFNASFTAEIVEIDRPRQVRAVLKGEDRRLASSLKVDAVLDVKPQDGASLVSYTMEMAMWGKLGRMGESIFRRRTAEVQDQFVEAFARACEAEPTPVLAPPPPVPAAPAANGSEQAQAGDGPLLQAAPAAVTPPAPSTPPRSGPPTSWWRRLLGLFRRPNGR